MAIFFFSSRRRHTRCLSDWSSDVCSSDLPDRGAGFLRVVARLKSGVSLSAAKVNLDAIGARLRHDYPDTNAKKLGVNLFPLHGEIVGDARALLLTLLGAVVLLLFIACANIANLMLV